MDETRAFVAICPECGAHVAGGYYRLPSQSAELRSDLNDWLARGLDVHEWTAGEQIRLNGCLQVCRRAQALLLRAQRLESLMEG